MTTRHFMDTLAGMETFYGIVVVLHLLSWAVVLGGWFATIRSPQVTPGMMHGSFAALLFGVILMGTAIASKEISDPNHMKLGVKGIIAVAVVILFVVAKRQLQAVSEIEQGVAEAGGESNESALAAATSSGARLLITLAGVLVIANVIIAVLWT